MNNYKGSADSLYEDIYDFDDINNDDSFSVNKNGHIVCSDPCVVRPKAKDDISRLPPIKQAGHRPTPNKNIQPNKSTRNHPKSKAGLANVERKTEQNNQRAFTRLQQNSGSDLTRSTPRLKSSAGVKSNHERRSNHIDDDDFCRILMQDVDDTKMYEQSPQVRDYDKKNNLRHKDQAFLPVPPKGSKAETGTIQSTTTRRRLSRINSQLEQDVSCHNPSKPYYKPTPPKSEVEINYERDIQEALRVEKELARFTNALKKQKNSDHSFDTEMLPPTSAMASNSFHQKQSTPCNVPTSAAPCKTTDHMNKWTSDEAKRALGFKSKVGKSQDKQAIDVSRIPEKIRKQMKKYFN